MSELVSICMATYNGEAYIKEQLDSLIDQDYKNIEIIVQDDNSQDKTYEILQEYAKKYKFIKVFQNKENIGYIKNFESLIQRANGDYIALCDQDDIWKKDKLSLLVNQIKDNSLVYANSLLVDKNLNSLGMTLSQKLNNNFISSKDPLNFLLDNSVSAHAMMFKKELVEYLKTFPTTIYFDQYIAMVAASQNGVKYIDKELVLYRQHSHNTLKKEKKAKKSLFQKIKNKLQKKVDENTANIKRVKEIKKLDTLKTEDKKLLQKLEKIYMDFKKSFINLEALLFFIKYKERFLKITRKNAIIYAIKSSIGYKLYRILPIL